MSTRIPDMRTTLIIHEALIDEARELLGFKSKTDTVILSLRELIRRRIEELKALMVPVWLEIDAPRSRRRPARSGRSRTA
jgi:Arc/MetJ family transcription regulator